MIRSGLASELSKDSGAWVFVDLGFARKAKSCGLLIADGKPEEVTFATLVNKLTESAISSNEPMNLLLEAPLSVAFDKWGNPTGRSVERRGKTTRYWYVGLGCSVLVAATYVLRALLALDISREIRLFEGLASFKPKGSMWTHCDDVVALRDVAWNRDSPFGKILGPNELKSDVGDRLLSAFAVSGMDIGVPPVVALYDRTVDVELKKTELDRS